MEQKYDIGWDLSDEPSAAPLQPATVGTLPVTTMIYIDDVTGSEAHGAFENVFGATC